MVLPSLTFAFEDRLEIYWLILIASHQLEFKKHSYSSAVKIIIITHDPTFTFLIM